MASDRDVLPRLVRAGVFTAITDFLFSTILVIFFYHSTFARLWQGVASTLLGPEAINGGTRYTLIGIAMHVGVAFGWSAVFLFVMMRMAWVRTLLATPNGVLKVAAIYGPFIWMVMSLALIPLLRHTAPSITFRWWVQFFGHIPFVALPMISSLAPGEPE